MDVFPDSYEGQPEPFFEDTEVDDGLLPPPPPPRFRQPEWGYRIALAYLVSVCLVVLASRLLGERLWWTTLLIYIPQVAFAVPGALLLIPMLCSRDRRALAVFGLTLLTIAGPVMGYNIPFPSLAQREAPRVRVLSYNIKGALSGIELIQAQVRTYRPDVVIFSEARGWSDDAALRKDLADTFPGWSFVEGGDVYIASRWPFVSTEALPLGTEFTRDPSLDRFKVRAEVAAPFGRFQVVGAHFRTAVYGRTLFKELKKLPNYMKHTGAIRKDQARDLMAWVNQLNGPVILAGDFNTPPSGLIYRSIKSRFGDAFAERGLGWGYTYPNTHPILRIDYVFHSRDWDVAQCRVGAAEGSDHRPVFAELALRQPTEGSRRQ